MKKIKATRLRDFAILAGVLLSSMAITTVLVAGANDNNPLAGSVFILAVAIISRYTTGYFYGIVASVIGVLLVNYMFTYPFFKLDITITGYPLTFTVMLLVSVIISALSTRLKKQERLRFEAENEKMRANLLRGVSHDIRTPLSSIMGASQTLLENDSLSRNERDELLKSINADARWLIRTTENLLSITRFNAKGVRIKKTAEVVEEIVGYAIVKFHKNYPDMPVNVVKPDEILLVPMDATLVGQVLINLFENVAIHALGATRIDLEITATPSETLFRVSDDGKGIPEDILPHLFDGRLEIATREISDDRRSMGIGLCVCSSIIQAHGGYMRAENKKTGGASVLFCLPGGVKDSAN